MNRAPECIIVGYAGVDRVIRVKEIAPEGTTSIILNQDNRTIYFGGNGSNVAYCMARLGCAAYPLMRVGALDEEKLGYIEHFKAAGVLTQGIQIIPNETTSVCHLVEDEQGNHLTMSYPGAMHVKYATEDYDDEIFQQAKYGILTVGTYADTVQFLQKCRKNKLPLVLAMRVDRASFPQVILKDILYEAEIIFTNEVERSLIESDYELESIVDLMEMGAAKIIVTTVGCRGCLVYEKRGDSIVEHCVLATPPAQVKDATGAGDSFIAGFMYGLLRGHPVEVCAQYGSTTATFVIEEVGCITSAPSEQQMLARNKMR